MSRARTQLTAAQLRSFRGLLLAKRVELVGDLMAIEGSELASDDGDLSHLPIHMADQGTDAYQADVMRSLAENERALLLEIDGALQRIENRTYGLCEATGAPIPVERLEAVPWARCTVEAERQQESIG